MCINDIKKIGVRFSQSLLAMCYLIDMFTFSTILDLIEDNYRMIALKNVT